MKKLISLTLCLLCISYAYSQKGKVVDLEKLKTAFVAEKNHDNAVAYMSALEKVGGQEATIITVMDSLFTTEDVDKFSPKTWYFFDRYVTDLEAPFMRNILLDKYWSNRMWGSEKVNNKITRMTMKMVAEVYGGSTKYSREFIENYVIALNSFDLSEFDNLGLCAYMLKLKLDGNYSYAISVLQFAIINYGDREWVNELYQLAIDCAKSSKNPLDKSRVEEYLDREVLNYYVSADKYKKLAELVQKQ